MGLQRLDDQVAMSEINVTPLVDVMLVLLVVFIVTAPLLVQAVKVDLPKTAAVPPFAQTRALQITIDATGAIHVDGHPTDLTELAQALQRMVEADIPDVQLHADERVPYGRVAQVMAVAHRAGTSRLSFVTRADASEQESRGSAAP